MPKSIERVRLLGEACSESIDFGALIGKELTCRIEGIVIIRVYEVQCILEVDCITKIVAAAQP